MDDLISRSETVAAICRLYTNHGKVQMGINLALDAVEEQPSVAAEPVRHGDWLRTSPATWECSVCRAQYRGTPVRPNWSRYCHNCGARMDTKEKESDG